MKIYKPTQSQQKNIILIFDLRIWPCLWYDFKPVQRYSLHSTL